MSLFNELKRRNVFRVGIAYTVTAWLLIQVTDIVFPRIGLPDSAVTLVIALLTRRGRRGVRFNFPDTELSLSSVISGEIEPDPSSASVISGEIEPDPSSGN